MRNRAHRRFAAAMAFMLVLPQAANADELVSGLSTDVIEINSSFTGTDIVLFGAIETSDSFAQQQGDDIVVVIRGPAVDMTVRRKERVAGIWLNAEQVKFEGMPGYYFLASTRPLQNIAALDILQRFGLGAANLQALTDVGVKPKKANLFREAVIRNEKKVGLYWESPTGIEFLSHSLFRARIPVPASVPPGQYKAEVYLFRGGNIISAQSTPLFIDKTGIERRLFEAAHTQSLLYGLATMTMALMLGWLAYVLFRQRELN
jgi:uncharacterized protein (TIGR02186 family)